MAIEFYGPSKLHISNRPTKANMIILQFLYERWAKPTNLTRNSHNQDLFTFGS